jgi:hypothetical protein
MQQIYTAKNEMEAHFVQALLEEEEIESVIQGEALEGAWGNLPLSDSALPTLWVDENDVAKAEPIIEEYKRRGMVHSKEPETEDEKDEKLGPTWKCPKCGEEVEEQFDECWNCGTAKPGTGNPNDESPKSESSPKSE